MNIHPNEAKSHEYGWTRDGTEEFCSEPSTKRLAELLIADMRKQHSFSESIRFFVRETKEWAE